MKRTQLAEHFAPLLATHPTALGNVYCGADCGPGWLPLLLPVIAACERAGVEIHQIKEKFGLLRVYVGQAEREIYDIIAAAESASAKVCEECGAAGARRGEAWIQTRCDGCAK